MTAHAVTGEVALRDFADSDASLLFEWMRDPESVRMAAFTARDPSDRERFDGWLRRIRGNCANLLKTVLLSGAPVGIISTFEIEGEREVTYWIDRARWGQGLASRALQEMLLIEATRPLSARAASANIGSVTVLLRAGFEEVARDVGFAAGVDAEVEEIIFRLDA